MNESPVPLASPPSQDDDTFSHSLSEAGIERDTAREVAHGGIDIRGGEVRAGGDIVGGDVRIAGDAIRAQTVTVQRGFSASDVQRIVLVVGVLIFVTAACFFAFGAASAAAIVAIINRPLPGGSSLEAAAAMQHKIEALNSLQLGQSFRVTFTEEEVSSYFRFVVGPQLGISDGKARFMDTPGAIVIGGNLDAAGGLPFLARLNITTTAQPLALESVWLKVLPTPSNSGFGWIPVTPLAYQLGARINAWLFGKVQFTQIEQVGAAGPVIGERALVLWGFAK